MEAYIAQELKIVDTTKTKAVDCSLRGTKVSIPRFEAMEDIDPSTRINILYGLITREPGTTHGNQVARINAAIPDAGIP